MEINGVPLHPLVVHAVVVFVPLGALSAILYAVVPRWRWLLRWPTLLLALAAVVLTRTAVITGSDLRDKKNFSGELADRVDRHLAWGHRLEYSVWVLAVMAIVAWGVLPYVDRLIGREGRLSPTPALVTTVTVVLPIVGAVVLVFAIITGDAGARAVWQE